MKYERLDDSPICALASPPGTSALAIIRLSGAGCVKLLAAIFSRPQALIDAPGHQLLHGTLRHPKTGQTLDEVLLAVYRAPRSYTGEEMAEINCHGNPGGIQALLSALLECGFRAAMPGEFTMRAFLSGKLDLSRAEAVHELIKAQGESARSLALSRLAGAVEQAVRRARDNLADFMAAVSVQINYPEDELDGMVLDPEKLRLAQGQVATLVTSYQSGRLYQEGVRLVLAGRTNAGKSSLFNALVREERAIVSEQHGTTRDWLEAPFLLDDVPVRLFDTAGLREAGDLVEQEGIRRTGQVVQTASVVLYVVDGSLGLEPSEARYIKDLQDRQVPLVLAWNKNDHPKWQAPSGLDSGISWVSVAARNYTGIDRLLEALRVHIVPRGIDVHADVLVDSPRQFMLLNRALEAIDRAVEVHQAALGLDLMAQDVQEALDALGEISGEIYTDDILDRVFSGFCLGK